MRFLRRHEDKVRTTTARCLLGQRKRGQIISTQDTRYLKVKKRQILPHGILKHYMRAILRKHLFEVGIPRWWIQNRRNTGSGKRLLELRDERRKRRLIAFEHEQALRSKAQNLPTEFEPQCPTGACYQHPFSRQYGWQRGGGERHIRSLEQQLCPLCLSSFREGWKEPIRHPHALTGLDNRCDITGRGTR